MSKWFEPLPLSPPSETQTPGASISGKRAWAASPLVCFRPAVRTVADLHAAPGEQRDVGVVDVDHVGELGVAASSTPSASSSASGMRVGRLAARDARPGASSPSPTPWRSASALAPWISASEHVPKPSSSGQARDAGPAAPAPIASEHRLRWPRAPRRSSAACGRGRRSRSHVHRPRIARMPTLSTASRDRAHVEERARLAERRGAGADHLDAGEERGRLLLLRRHHRVERDQPVRAGSGRRGCRRGGGRGSGARRGERACPRSRASTTGAGPSITRSGGRGGRTGRGRPDLDDVAAVHQDRAVAQDPPLAVDA